VPHRPDRDACRYLGGTLTSAERDRFDAHLLTCRTCWVQVQQARAGRAAVEGVREVAPAHLRERVRALVDAESASGPAVRRRRLPGRAVHGRRVPGRAAAAAVLVAAAVSGVLVLHLDGPDEASVEQAVADYAARELPGTQMPEVAAPDLSALRLQAVAAGAGSYASLPVDAYAYTDPSGRRVALYLSEAPFPEPADAQPLAAPGGPWMAHEAGAAVLCAMPADGRPATSILIVGQDDALVTAAARALGVAVG